jgi:hypothetical protein
MMSVIKNNLMTVPNYTPYCGNETGLCPLPRTHFDGEQFFCKHCGWRSGFDADFIAEYKAKWGLAALKRYFLNGTGIHEPKGIFKVDKNGRCVV